MRKRKAREEKMGEENKSDLIEQGERRRKLRKKVKQES